ncbi:MAG: hypothetical protein VB858_21025, partial [Planctomycetaceae bacterium]
MNRQSCLVPLVCAAVLSSWSAPATSAQPVKELSAIELLPSGCLAVARMPHPDRLLTTLTEHAVWQKIQAQPEYKSAVANPGYLLFLGVVKTVEMQVGMEW